MNCRKRTITTSVLTSGVVLLLVGLSAGFAQAECRSRPGFVDTEALTALSSGSDETIRITLEGPMLKVMSQAAGHAADDFELGELAQDLDCMNVMVVEDLTPERHNLALTMVKDLRSQLSQRDWKPMVEIREEDEQIYVMSHGGGDVIQGLTVIVLEEDEFVFINLVGQLKPENLARLMEQYGGMGQSMMGRGPGAPKR